MSIGRSWRVVVLVSLLSCWGILSADDTDDLIKKITAQTKIRAEAAKKLLAGAESLGDLPEAQVRLYVKAYEYGITSRLGYATALEALDKLEKAAPQKLSVWRDKRLEVYREQYYRGNRDDRAANGQVLVEALVARAGQCNKAGDWRNAVKYYRQAYGVARAIDLPGKGDILEKAQAIETLAGVHNRIAAMKKALAKTPSAVVRKRLVMAYLVDLDMPPEAAKHLDETLDATVRKNVSLAAGGAAAMKDADFLTLGKWYKALAATTAVKDVRTNMLTRARDNLKLYLEVYSAKDITRLGAVDDLKTVEAQLQEIRESSGSKRVDVSVKPPALPPGAVLFLTFEKHTLFTDKGQTYVRDQSGAKHHGLVTGGTSSPRAGGKAMVFDGKAYVNLGNPPGLKITGNITISAWIKPKTVDGIRNIVAHGHAQSPKGEVQLRIVDGWYETGSWTGTGHKVRNGASHKVRNGASHNVTYAMPSGDIGNWVHLAGTYDGKMWRLYRNGAQVASSADRVGAVPVKANWAIGARGNGEERHFNGAIDEVGIFNRALSAEEIRRLYAPGKARAKR